VTVAEIISKRIAPDDGAAPVPPPAPVVGGAPAQGRAPMARVGPILITLTTAAAAGILGWAMWDAYMSAPWTRDATVRASVVMIAPEVSGRIVELHVIDNQFVRKGDLLMIIDPTNYMIAVNQAEASVQQAQASVQTIDAQMIVQQAQINANRAQLDQVQAGFAFAQKQASRYEDLAQKGAGTVESAQQYSAQLAQQQAAVRSAEANLELAQRQVESQKAQRLSAEATLAQAQSQLRQAQANLQRTRILSPVDGYVTNLLAQLGNFVNVGANAISLVDAQSYWVDGYFEETNIASIRAGDAAQIKLMGHPQTLRGHVESMARAISVSNAQPNNQGVATVNPIFTWVRLAQRIPIRIHIDEVPPDIILSAGMTATVEIEERAAVKMKKTWTGIFGAGRD
jgi:multidrug resistance efflux pump